jgi:hypothetical protein
MARGSLPHQRVCSQWWVILGPRRAVALRTDPTHHPAAQARPAHRQPLRAYGPKPPAYEQTAAAQVHHAVAKSALIQQLELKPGPVSRRGFETQAPTALPHR